MDWSIILPGVLFGLGVALVLFGMALRNAEQADREEQTGE